MTGPAWLRPGDCCLYAGREGLARIVQLKTWQRVSHCETYVGHDHVVAARPHTGVDYYRFERAGLCHILRPPVAGFRLPMALTWFHDRAQGQRYDWWGLLRFAWRAAIVSQRIAENKMFCSEFLTRFYRAGGLDPFPGEDADTISPHRFQRSVGFADVWTRGTGTGPAWGGGPCGSPDTRRTGPPSCDR